MQLPSLEKRAVMAKREVGGFDEWKQALFQSIEGLKIEVGAINTKIDQIRLSEMRKIEVDIAMLKVKASMWGAVGGTVGGAIVGALISKMLK